MENQTLNLKPIEHSERITALDIMRGIVLCGILLMNINGFGLAEAYSDPTVSGGATGWNLYTWITTNMLFEGTMRALFSLLFGVGMFILLDRMGKRHAGIKGADIYFRRLMWLLLFGIIHGYLLLWSGEILYNYAIMGFLVYSFRNLTSRDLVIVAIILFSIGGIWNYFEYKGNVKMVEQAEMATAYKAEGKELTKDMKDAEKTWQEILERRSPESIATTNEGMTKSYLSALAIVAPSTMHWKSYGLYRYDVWDILSMMLLGIALFKWNILSGEKSVKFYAIMVVLGYLVGLTVNYFETIHIINNNFSYVSFQESNITYDLGRVPVAIGHIGLIMLFSKLKILGWLKNAISSVGKMALTNYLMHSVICMIVFTGAGFGMFGKLERYELIFVVVGIWIFQLILSPIWLKYFHFGPAEWLWRRLSYLQSPPFKKMENIDVNTVIKY
ncbi:MAG: DUF418 domain-containing protein [Saprospiraceae bacterium]